MLYLGVALAILWAVTDIMDFNHRKNSWIGQIGKNCDVLGRSKLIYIGSWHYPENRAPY